MAATIGTLETEVTKSRGYLDRVEQQDQGVAHGSLDLGDSTVSAGSDAARRGDSGAMRGWFLRSPLRTRRATRSRERVRRADASRPATTCSPPWPGSRRWSPPAPCRRRVASRVRRVDRVVRDTIPRLGSLGAGSPQAYSVMATATDYLPEAVGGYLRLPRQFADNRPVDRGKSSLMLLIDQLDLLASTMDKVFDAVCRDDAAALVAHGRFLARRSSGPPRRAAALDVGSAPRPAMPTAPPHARGPRRRELRLQPPPDGRPDERRGRPAAHPHAGEALVDALAAWPAAAGVDPQVARDRRRWPWPPRWPSPPPGQPPTGSARPAGATHPGLLRRRQPRTSVARRPHGDPQLAGRAGLAAAATYAAALAEVASAACQLGEPTMRVIGNASVAAAAQLARRRRRGRCRRRSTVETRVQTGATPPAPSARRSTRTERRGTGAPEEPERSLDELLAELDALIGLGRVKREIHRQVARAARREAAGRGRAEESHDHPPPRLHRQPGHRQDDRRPAGQRHLPRPRAAVQGPAGRGRPLRAGRRLPRADGDEDGRRRRLRRRRGAVHRRGLQPDRDRPPGRPVRPGGRRHPGQGDGGPPRRPRGDRGRLPGTRWRPSSPRTRVWPAGSAPRSSSRTTPTTSSSTILHQLAAGADYELVPEAVERFRETLGARHAGTAFGNGRFARNALEAAIGHHAWRLRDIEAPTLDQLRQLVAQDFDEDPLDDETGPTPSPMDDASRNPGPRPSPDVGRQVVTTARSAGPPAPRRAARRPSADRRRTAAGHRAEGRLGGCVGVRAFRLRGHARAGCAGSPPSRSSPRCCSAWRRRTRFRAADGALDAGRGQHRPADPGPGDPEPARPGRRRRHQRLPGRRPRAAGAARRLHRGHHLGLEADRRGGPEPARRRRGAGRAERGAGHLRERRSSRRGPTTARPSRSARSTSRTRAPSLRADALPLLHEPGRRQQRSASPRSSTTPAAPSCGSSSVGLLTLLVLGFAPGLARSPDPPLRERAAGRRGGDRARDHSSSVPSGSSASASKVDDVRDGVYAATLSTAAGPDRRRSTPSPTRASR